jgi:hypothetical protein
MAKFFVGQRVRVVCEGSEFDGVETRVLELDFPGFDPEDGEYIGCRVDLVYENGPVSFEDHELEPILPEGAQPSEFSFTELMDNLGVVVV